MILGVDIHLPKSKMSNPPQVIDGKCISTCRFVGMLYVVN